MKADNIKDEYIKGITILLKECNDIELLDLIWKLLLKNKP